MVVNSIKEPFPKVYAEMKKSNVCDHWSMESASASSTLNWLLRSVGLLESVREVHLEERLTILENKLV